MRKRLKHALILLLITALLTSSSQMVIASSTVTPLVSGIFIAPELSSDVSATEWTATLQDMANIGIETVIIQYSYQTDSINGNQAYYNYWQSDTVADASSHPARRSQIERILSAAQNTGIQVYLGLQLAEREWFNENLYQNYDWLYHHYWLSTDLANSLWNAFGQNYADTIAGWYLPFEFESTSEYNAYFSQLTSVYYAPVTSYLKNDSRFGHLPIMISPLMYWSDSKTNWESNLNTVLSGSQIDILAPQDGIGAGTQTQATVGDWYRACRDAVNAVNTVSNKTISLWGNCENYARLRNPNEALTYERIKPMSINKFIDSLTIAMPYVDKLITFSIHRWDIAQYYNSALGINQSYYNAYKRYYTTGIRSASKSDGYYVDIQPTNNASLSFNTYAAAGLTDGFAANTNWSNFKGIHSSSNQPFTIEIRFDDSISITSISSYYYQDSNAGIVLPQQVTYQYFIRSGENQEILTYTQISNHQPSGVNPTVLSTGCLTTPVLVDGIRVTVIPNGEWTFLDEIWIQ